MPFLKSPLPSSSRSNNIQLVAWTYTTDWWFGTWILLFHSVGNGIIIPTVTHSIIFQRGRFNHHQPDYFAITQNGQALLRYRFFIVRPGCRGLLGLGANAQRRTLCSPSPVVSKRERLGKLRGARGWKSGHCPNNSSGNSSGMNEHQVLSLTLW